jgi:hypothetical protein
MRTVISHLQQLHSVSQATISILHSSSKSNILGIRSHLSAGSDMSYDARSFAGSSSLMISHSMAPSAQLNYYAFRSFIHRPNGTYLKCNHIFPLAQICAMTPGVSQDHLQ